MGSTHTHTMGNRHTNQVDITTIKLTDHTWVTARTIMLFITNNNCSITTDG
jgi:hypothetical protein